MKKNHRFLGVGNLVVSFDFCLSTTFPLPAHFERISILIHNIRRKDTKNILRRKENDGFLNAKNEKQWDDNQVNTECRRRGCSMKIPTAKFTNSEADQHAVTNSEAHQQRSS